LYQLKYLKLFFIHIFDLDKKNAYLWGNRREVGVIIYLFLEYLDDNHSQMLCQ